MVKEDQEANTPYKEPLPSPLTEGDHVPALGEALKEILGMNSRSSRNAFTIVALPYLNDEQIFHLTGLAVEKIARLRTLVDQNKATFDWLHRYYRLANLQKLSERGLAGPKKRQRFGAKAGYRPDLMLSVKSKSEANTARYLGWRFGTSSYLYEPEAYPIQLTVRKNTIQQDYIPDFKVTVLNKNGEAEFFLVEVKPGFLPGTRDPEKMRAFKKQYPKIPVIFVTNKNGMYKQKKGITVSELAEELGYEVWFLDDMIREAKKYNVRFE